MSCGRPDGFSTRYSWAIGTTGTVTPASAPSSPANMPPAFTTISVSIAPRSVSTPMTRPRSARIAVTRVLRGHLGAAPPRALCEREGQLARVDVAVRRQERGTEHAVGRHRREERLRLRRRDQLEREAERLRPAGLAGDLLHPLLATRRAAGSRPRASPSRARPPPRASGTGRRSPSSSSSARATSAAGRRGRPSERSSRSSGRPARRGRRRPSRAAPASRGSSSRRPRRRSRPPSPYRALRLLACRPATSGAT